MTEYKIERWDALSLGDPTGIRPAVYITPDVRFLDFIKNQQYKVKCLIRGTGLEYDNKVVFGTVDRSSDVPNCRPNYYDKTGQYIITLHAPWIEYPRSDALGTISFPDMEVLMGPLAKSKMRSINSNQSSGFSAGEIVVIILVVLGFLVLLSWVGSPDKNSQEKK
jgi:hypothetical protein